MLWNRHTQTKKYGPNERTDQNSKNRTKQRGDSLFGEEISDAEFKTLVIRMLTEMVGYDCKIEEEVKAMQSAIKKKYTRNQQGREGNWDSNKRFGPEGRKKHSTRTE